MKKIERDTFIMYRSFFESIKGFDKETIADIFLAICELGLNGKEIELNGIAKNIFILIKPQIEANNRKYLNGKQGGRPEKNWENSQKPNNNQNETKTKPNHNLMYNDKCIMNNEEGIMYNEEGIINNELFLLENNSEAEKKDINLKEDNSLNIKEYKEKEKSSAKKEKENYGNEGINELVDRIKEECNILGIAYDKTKEREFGKHILTAKEYGKFCENIGQDRIEFAINILKASAMIDYRKGICSGPMKIYQNYSEVYNQTIMRKGQNKNIVVHIDEF